MSVLHLAIGQATNAQPFANASAVCLLPHGLIGNLRRPRPRLPRAEKPK
jgi:hypothetical protein